MNLWIYVQYIITVYLDGLLPDSVSMGSSRDFSKKSTNIITVWHSNSTLSYIHQNRLNKLMEREYKCTPISLQHLA